MPPIISVRRLVKRYGALEAVRGISFEVERGEIFGLLGPNGAGKTTTVEILEGLRRSDGGSATVAGVDVARDPAGVKERIGVQLQASAFPENFLAREVVDLFALFYGRRVDALALLRTVDLEDRAGSRHEKLSGGQRQRLSVAVAMVNEPEVLFLTTHYLDEAEILCDRVAVMDGGRIIALDAPSALVAALLARGFTKPALQQQANLEDVFLDLTGHELREE